MIYRLVEADEVISRLDNDFNVNTGDWVPRIPQWIYQCLSDLNIRLGLIPKAHIATVVNFQAHIPEDLEQMIGVEYNGSKLDRRTTTQYKNQSTNTYSNIILQTNIGVTVEGTLKNVTLDDDLENIKINVDKIRVYDASSITELPSSNHYYYLLPNGRIETSFETGYVIFHYYTLPYSYNKTVNSKCPLIPDTEAIKDAITWYLFQSILQRGTKHPIFSIGNPNWKLDPYERYRKSRLNAKNKARNLDPDQARILDRMWQSHLYNVIARER